MSSWLENLMVSMDLQEAHYLVLGGTFALATATVREVKI
jgi:hypothetical protein